MLKRQEIQPELRTNLNLNIQGLRKKTTPFSRKPNNRRLWQAWGSFERNGMVNLWLSRNWVRLVFPMVPMFFFAYMCQPFIHGWTYINWYNNYQWQSVYHKLETHRMVYGDNTITRIA